jgi:hypothetical protein
MWIDREARKKTLYPRITLRCASTSNDSGYSFDAGWSSAEPPIAERVLKAG